MRRSSRPPTRWAVPLLMLLAGPGSAVAQATPAAARVEARLDSLYGPLVYIMHDDERGIYPSLSLAGKRRFLERFWARRDPTPRTARNEAEQAYDARIGYVNRTFSEDGRREVRGWRTDRGRIYLKYGPPDRTLRRHSPGTRLPFEVWRYSAKQGARERKYCFVDLTGFGNYTLVYSNDPAEPTWGDWRRLLGPDASEDVMRF
jgi:GWxTD domain-containing protein